jgi:MFS family permease
LREEETPPRQVYATFANLFNIYWFQDIVGAHGFSLFGHHITDSPRSALALTATINSIISLVVTLPAGWLADRFPNDRARELAFYAYLPRVNPPFDYSCRSSAATRPCILSESKMWRPLLALWVGLMFYSSLITTLCPLVNAYLPTYTWTVCCNLFSGVTAGFTGVCSRSLQADCVPFDPVTKRPREPARDFMVMQYASVIPSLIIPALLGIAFGLFPSRAEGYKVFFLISAAIHFVSSVLYLKVQWTQNTARAQAKRFLDRLTSGEVQESDNEADLAVVAKQRRAPLGARFCDRLLFGEELRRWLEESVRMPRSGGGDNANARGLLATRKGGHAA